MTGKVQKKQVIYFHCGPLENEEKLGIVRNMSISCSIFMFWCFEDVSLIVFPLKQHYYANLDYSNSLIFFLFPQFLWLFRVTDISG